MFIGYKKATLGCYLIITLLLLSSKGFSAGSVKESLKLNGIATHTEFGGDQFMAALFLNSPSTYANSIMFDDSNQRLEIKVLAKKISSRSFRQLWLEGIAINSAENDIKEQIGNFERFAKILKLNFIKHDVLIFERSDNVLTIRLNNTSIGTINDGNFYSLLLSAFIGNVPLSSGFKSGLLANGKVDTLLSKKFASIVTPQDRVEEVQLTFSNATSKIKKMASTTSALPQKKSSAIVKKPEVPVPTVEPVERLTFKKALEKIANVNNTSSEKPADIPPAQVKRESQTVANMTKKSKAEKVSGKKISSKKTSGKKARPSLVASDDNDDISGKSLLEQQLYRKKLKFWMNGITKYPRLSEQKGHEGNVKIRILVDQKGRILKTKYLEKSQYYSLNKAAMKAVKRAAPFPAMPGNLKLKEYSFNVPIVFKLAN